MLRSLVTQLQRGVSQPGRADRAIYGGKKIMFGNNVGKDKKSPNRFGFLFSGWFFFFFFSFSLLTAVCLVSGSTLRTWNPNVQSKRLYSDILEKTLKLRVTTHALRCIAKAGSLDQYLVHTKVCAPYVGPPNPVFTVYMYHLRSPKTWRPSWHGHCGSR
jgi:ribosomal protein L28